MSVTPYKNDRRWKISSSEEFSVCFPSTRLDHHLVNPQLPPALRAKASTLEMKMKQHLVEHSLLNRPSLPELQQTHPGVFASLTTEARDGWQRMESKTMKKVHISFVEATAEQMLISHHVSLDANHFSSFISTLIIRSLQRSITCWWILCMGSGMMRRSSCWMLFRPTVTRVI